MRVDVERAQEVTRVFVRPPRTAAIVSLGALLIVATVAALAPPPSTPAEGTVAWVAALFGAILAYACLVGIVNRLELTFDARDLRVRSRPLPWVGAFTARRDDVRAVTAAHERVVVRGVSRTRSEVLVAVGGQSYPLPLGPIGAEDCERVSSALREALGLERA